MRRYNRLKASIQKFSPDIVVLTLNYHYVSLTAKEAPQGRLSHFGALAICGTIVLSTLGTECAGATLSNPPKESAI